MAQDWNTKIIEEFRANRGRVGGPFANQPLLLLHHVGAKTGTERVNPLAYQALADGSVAVFASAGGQEGNPDWFANLLAHPDVSAEIGDTTRPVHARVADGAEREEIWTRQKEINPNFAEYETKTDRQIPVVVLEPRNG